MIVMEKIFPIMSRQGMGKRPSCLRDFCNSQRRAWFSSMHMDLAEVIFQRFQVVGFLPQHYVNVEAISISGRKLDIDFNCI